MRMEDVLDRLAWQMYEVGAFLDRTKSPGGKGFRLKLHATQPDAPLSPFYLDLRVLRSHPEARRLAVEALMKVSTDCSRYDAIADVPTGVTPIAAILADRLHVPLITPRMDVKQHGTGARIDGHFKPGDRVVLVDDILTGAASKFEATSVLTEAGLVVEDVLVLVDREQGGRHALAARGQSVHAVFTISDLIERWRRGSQLTAELVAEISSYLTLNR